MDKKTKLWLGAGILGVGAYLLLKSKKATAVVSAPANLVGFDSGNFYEPETVKYGTGEGVFANQTGGMINSMDVKGAKSGSMNQGIFANQDGKSFYQVKGGHAGVHGQGIFTNVTGKRMANMPFNFAGTDVDPVGERKMPFADITSTGREKYNAGGPIGDGAGNFSNATGEKDFFNPQTKQFGPNQGVFTPSKVKSPVVPNKPSTIAVPKNNMVGLINGPSVSAGAFSNR
jgi:hypothetical protein